MAANTRVEPGSFKDMEKTGWSRQAENYDGHLGNISRGAIGPMLDAVGITPGARLLEVACGPGYGSGMAAEKGVEAIGIDFAPTMVEEARRKFPGAEFREWDAEALEFEDAGFDAVICPLGMLHFPNPQKAISEAFRVLKPGGRYAFTVWCTPDKAKWLGIVRDAIEAHGDTGVPLPPAPPFFHFSDHDTSKNALAEAGFADIDITELPLTLTIEAPQALLDLVYKSTVRSAATLELQTETALTKIHEAIVAGVRRFEKEDSFVIPASVVLATASKP
jgi:ubiquinone/menaquinone biosynthesis C-methylase UbiE